MFSITIRMQYSYAGMLSRSIRILYINFRMLYLNTRMNYSYTRMHYFNILMDYINFFHTFTENKAHYAYTNAIITCNGKHLCRFC